MISDIIALWYTQKEWPQPYRMCQCGCGLVAPLATRTRYYLGTIVGEPISFIKGHERTGRLSPLKGQPGPRRTANDALRAHLDISLGASCWIWNGSVYRQGYGAAYWNGNKWLAHRLAYTAWVGPIPEGLDILHKCDIPACCNPDHLFIGTHQDNMRDMSRKGRAAKLRGSQQHNAKLTETQVLEIRSAKANGLTMRELSFRYGVNFNTIKSILYRVNWGWLKND